MMLILVPEFLQSVRRLALDINLEERKERIRHL